MQKDADDPEGPSPAVVPLPAPSTRAESYVGPTTDVEKTVLDVWHTVLGVKQIGIHDDFFALGGHSLIGQQLLDRLNQEYKEAKLSMRVLFDHPTVAGLAQRIEGVCD